MSPSTLQADKNAPSNFELYADLETCSDNIGSFGSGFRPESRGEVPGRKMYSQNGVTIV